MVPLPRLILSSRSLLPPWPPLTPPRVSFAHAGPSRRAPRSRSLRPAPVRDGEASTVRCRTQTKTHEGSGVTSRSLTVTVWTVPSALPFTAPPTLLFFPLRLRFYVEERAALRALSSRTFVFYSPFVCLRDALARVRLFSFFFSSCVSRVFLSSPLSSLREESTSAKVDRLYPVNQVAS